MRVTGAGFFPMLTDVDIVVTGSSSLRPLARRTAAHGAPCAVDASHVTGAAGHTAPPGRRAGNRRHAGRIPFHAARSRRLDTAGGRRPRHGAEDEVRDAPAGRGRPRARRHHRRPGHGPVRSRSTGGDVVVDVALTIAGLPAADPDRARRASATCESLDWVRSVEVRVATMDADERAAVMARARWKAREDAPETAVPADRPGAGHRVGQGRRRQVLGHGQPGRGPGRPRPHRRASSTPTSGASRSPGCSAWRATSRPGRARWSRSSARSARARCGCCRWGSSPTRSRRSCGAAWCSTGPCSSSSRTPTGATSTTS